jgi:hypothetical protein
MSWKDRMSFTTAKLSTILLMSIGAALVAVLLYTDGGALAAWGLSSRQYLWLTFAGGAALGFITVAARFASGEQWS